MGKKFSTCLLVQDGSNAPELLKNEVNLRLGYGFSPDQGKTTLLAGGFSSISPDSGFPLSPTLFLNYSLTSLGDETLKALADAELHKHNSVNYRSYTVDVDKRICVVSDDTGKLKSFIDTYSGLLDISPLLVKGYDSEIPTVTSLEFESRSDGCRLEFQIRSAIDFEKCTYCGACGVSCPEACISENLFVDYDRCTFCKECEKACEADAIDIHGAINESEDFPAILLLGEVKVELPADTPSVFYENDLSEYFKGLFPYQVDEVVTHSPSICQYNGNLGHGCDLCVSSCVHGAVMQGPKGVELDSLKCEECGACVSACPTGAIQNERFSDAAFIEYVQGVQLPKGGTVVFGDEDALHRLWWKNQGQRFDNLLFLEIENVGSLSAFHFLFLLSRGVRKIVVLEQHEPVAGARYFTKQIKLASMFTEKLYGVTDCILSCSVENFGESVAESAEPFFDYAISDSPFNNRRQKLSESLAAISAGSGKEISFTPEGYIPFASVTCDTDKCTQCMACLNDCKIGSMQADTDNLCLNHQGILCVGCGLCVRICPEDALSISPAFTLNETFFKGLTLAKAEPMACKECGKVFGTRKAFDRVMQILQQKEAVDMSHFEYCEDCRVVKLFDQE